MRIKLIPFLLALSFGFNIFCLGGYLAERKQVRQLQVPQKPLERLSQCLKLEPEQLQEVTQLIEYGRYEFNCLKNERAADVRRLMGELNQSQPDIETIRHLMQQNERQWQRAHQLSVQRWRDFLTHLTPDQRQKIISLD